MNKNKKNLLNNAYQRFIDAGLGKISSDNLNSIVYEKLMGFGTTEDEKIFNLSGFKEILERQKEQSRGMKLQWKIKPLYHYTSADENTAFFADEIFMRAKIDGETILMYIRISIVLSYISNNWKVIHWHASKPENVKSVEDTFGIKNWKQKAEALEKLVQERTADLKEKNRELEIETALEKVRTVAMGMKKRDDMLLICKTISQQLKKLGVKEIRNVQTAIFYPERGTYMNYEYYSKHDKTFITDVSYTNHKIHKAFALKMMKGKGEFYITHIKGRKKLDDWIAYQKTTNVFIDKYLKTTSSLNYYWFSLVPVALGISAYDPLTEKEKELFKRFLNVFELAYRRYLDIEKAEAQAREAEIQLALERVRARTMAMHKSEELAAVASVLFHQLQELDLPNLRRCLIGIVDEKRGRLQSWHTSLHGDSTHKVLDYPIDGHLVIKEKIKGWKKQKPFSIKLAPGELKSFINYIVKHGFEYNKGEKPATKLIQNHAPFKYGYLEVATHEPITENDFELLQRFAQVFEQTYTRFLDLQKAEEQAREAQIEAALERVRAKAMAMHKSEDFNPSVKTIFEEFEKLQMNMLRCGIGILHREKRTSDVWTTTKSETGTYFQISGDEPMDIHPLLQGDFDAWLRQEDFTYILEGKDLENYYQVLTETNFLLPDSASSSGIKKNYKQYYYATPFESGTLFAFRESEITSEARSVMKRFANVFNFTYKRFRDLQKAEAQAKEAEIQLALERVRARTMAMHSSAELADAASVLFQQILALDLKPSACGVVILDDKAKTGEVFITADGTVIPESFVLPYHGEPAQDKIFNAWKKKKSHIIVYLKGKELKTHLDYIAQNMPVGDMLEASGDRQPDQLALHIIYFRHGFLGINYPEPNEEVIPLLIRFAKVFEQTYTRFLDLQKSEAQAREAEIELALERVRARTMAMQKSEELKEAATVLYKELRSLNIGDMFNCGYVFVDEENNLQYAWMTHTDGSIRDAHAMPLRGDKVLDERYDKWKKGVKLFSQKVGGEKLKKHNAFTTRQSNQAPENNKGLSKLPDPVIFYCGNFSDGYLHILSREELNKESESILTRFSKVFEQTYTRFLDLQKAEAQAREAEIQLALERVRARTMAMQKSDELPEAANLLFQQVQSLQMPAWSAGYCIWAGDTQAVTLWMSTQGALQQPFTAPTTEDELFIQMRVGHEKGNALHIVEMGGEDLVLHYKYMSTLPVVGKILESVVEAGHPLPSYQIMHYAYFSKGFLLFITYEPVPEAHEIFKRFANVFEQTYTRFLDLKKAEAQARESQIQLAMERVRARTMAMQKSYELADVVGVLYKQLTELDFGLSQVLIAIIDKTNNVIEWWSRGFGIETLPKCYHIPIIDHPFLNQWINTWESGIEYSVYNLAGDVKKSYDEYLFSQTDLKDFPHEVQQAMRSAESLYLCDAYIRHGSIQSAGPVPLNDDQVQILKKFATVLNHTYTRLIDLQKAEAQAREAEIELSLERVRARTMAMHRSTELSEVSSLLYKELQGLGVTRFINCGYVEIDKATNIQNAWMTTDDGSGVNMVQLPLTGDKVFNERYDAWKRKEKIYHQVIGGDLLKSHIEFATQHYRKTEIDEMVRTRFIDPTIFYCSNFSHGYLHIVTDTLLSEEAETLLVRFTGVFEMTYKRFLDLQKAEAQAREAEIQLALERVRAKTMAMHKSEELSEVAAVLFQQLNVLGNSPERINIGIVKEEKGIIEYWATEQGGNQINHSFNATIKEPTTIAKVYAGWKENKRSMVVDLRGDELNAWMRYLLKELNMPFKEELVHERRVHTAAFFSHGMLLISTPEPVPQETINLLERFADVFNLTYRRFLDLQKSEAQTRESQIQLALERVRARTMAMQKSDELPETSLLLFQQVKELGMTAVQNSIGIINEEAGYIELSTTVHGHNLPRTLHVPIDDPYVMAKAVAAWKAKRKSLKLEFEGQELKNYNEHRNSFFETKVDFPEDLWVVNLVFFSKGWLSFSCNKNIPGETFELLKRFTAVFEQTYIRFNDLKQAEAQARESQIEASLERVRARTMAMHKSPELSEVAVTIHKELIALKVTQFIGCGYVAIDEKNKIQYGWTTKPDGSLMDPYHLPLTGEPGMQKRYEAWKRKDPLFSQTLGGEELKRHIAFASPHFGSKEVEEVVINFFPDPTIFYCSNFSHGYLSLITGKRLTGEEETLLIRFRKVFEQSYARFLDLQKAEAQAREAQIEAALERVRAKSMAMHKSEELRELVFEFYNQIHQFGFAKWGFEIKIAKEDKSGFYCWISPPGARIQPEGFNIPTLDHWVLKKYWSVFEKQIPITSIEVSGEDKKQLSRLLLEKSDMKLLPQEVKTNILDTNYVHFSVASMRYGLLKAVDIEPVTEKDFNILQRFAKVFEQTYTRFLDLQRAETQAREAQIEAALERVRGKAMAMHSSKDLSETVAVFFKELKSLGITPLRCGVGEIDEKQRISSISATTASKQGDSYEVIGKLNLEGHPVLDAVFDHWKKQEEYYPVLKGAEIKPYYKAMNPQVSFPDHPENETQFGSYFYFKEGLVFAWTDKELSELEKRIFRRFTTVISLTYRRYMDLQQSEAIAREAVKQAALDRIRADIASMRTVEDLQRITPVIWNELSILNVPFIRCGIFIMDDDVQQIHTFLSTPDGKAIASFHLPYNTSANIADVIAYWRQNRSYVNHWGIEEFTSVADTLVQQGTITSREQYMRSLPDDGIYLHFIPFLQGMLYVGNTGSLNNDDLNLLHSVADAFSTAYARYEDFNKLEAAKEQVENTLTDLRQAQKQLIQSEKMASLGELTAGIAHEIQNPLNFVNNFSEVTNELIEELKIKNEKLKIEDEELNELLNDISQNLEKINHHGKRADGIVKGMLQHSRAGSGQKEPTDINALCDEYLRLAFHGLRAKEKSFNAKLETDFDNSIGNVEIMTQDIGRVILNLINNAFYAVNEKVKQNIERYDPTVTVSTKKINNKVEISVKDNGNGIPDPIKEKIFQPFFTTKPTGQGTGLGLSLSYDIVKAHGGEIKVETSEGKGTLFIINLPIQS